MCVFDLDEIVRCCSLAQRSLFCFANVFRSCRAAAQKYLLSSLFSAIWKKTFYEQKWSVIFYYCAPLQGPYPTPLCPSILSPVFL